jgi:hypothetical protein
MTTGYTRRFSTVPRPVRAHAGSMHGVGTSDETDPSAITRSAINPAQDPLSAPQPVERPIWIDPPTNWENIDQIAYALLPAIGATVTIISFTVPAGRNGVVNKVACNFVGGGWVEGSGDVIWKILIDGTPPAGANSYNSIVASLGSPASPVEISGFRIFENQVLTLVAFNNPGGPNGGIVVAGQRVGARLLGHLYPRELENSSIWI